MAGKPQVVELITPAPASEINQFRDLATVALEALRMRPQYFRSIFGPPQSWLPPHRQFSEYNILDPWRPLRTGRYLLDLTVPASAETAPDWARMLFPPIVNRRLWRPTSFFSQSDAYGGVCTFPDEHWIFINGVGTNSDVARLNAAFIANLFHRPLNVIQNATDSILLDLYECAIGKGFKDDPDSADRKTMTESAWRATAAVLEALNANRTRRVVVIAHSQGTVIMANVLRAVRKVLHSKLLRQKRPKWHGFTKAMMGGVETDVQKIVRDKLAHALFEFGKDGHAPALERLAKLEIYTFANCADKMRYADASRKIPYMEHFANEHDLVARLGILSPLRGDSTRLVEIDGPVFEQRGAWGHLLNEHYLAAIDDYLYPGACKHRRDDNPYPRRGRGRSTSRLYEYFHGKQPGHA